MTLTVTVLLSYIQYCGVGPAVIRTICKCSRKILIRGVIFALVRFSSEMP